MNIVALDRQFPTGGRFIGGIVVNGWAFWVNRLQVMSLVSKKELEGLGRLNAFGKARLGKRPSHDYVMTKRDRTLRIALQRFTELYLADVKVSLVKDVDVFGQAYRDKRKIVINVRQDPNAAGCSLGGGNDAEYGLTLLKPPKMTHDECYYFTLLHEIGHFVLKDKVPRVYPQIKKAVRREYPDDNEARAYAIQDYIARKDGETDEEWRGRIADIESWVLQGETLSLHLRVDDWARSEFLKKRGQIRRSLLELGFSA